MKLAIVFPLFFSLQKLPLIYSGSPTSLSEVYTYEASLLDTKFRGDNLVLAKEPILSACVSTPRGLYARGNLAARQVIEAPGGLQISRAV